MAENMDIQGERQSNHEDDGGGVGVVAPEKSEADIDKSELRTDPEDDKTYTWAEFKAAKLESFCLQELVDYWFDDMAPDFPDGTKVVVSNLSKSISDDTLTEAFRQAGELAFCQVYYDANEESKGFAKLQFVTAEAADAAIIRWHGAELGGQQLSVRRLMDKGKNTTICVGGIDPETSPASLEKVFAEVGEVVDVFIPNGREAGDTRRVAKIEFICPESVEQACSRFHLKDLGGRRVCCVPWVVRTIPWSGRIVRNSGPSVMVSRMSSETSAESLLQLFDSVEGMVVCNLRMLTERDTGNFRGVANVEIGDEALVDLAISKLNGAELDGSSIVVTPFDAEGRPPRLPTVLCRQLSASTTVTQLKEHFAKFNCNGAKILFDRESGKHRGIAIVEFHDEESAREASEELNGSHLDGATIHVVRGPKPSRGFPVFVNGLGLDITERAVGELFMAAGEVQNVSIFKDRETNVPSGKVIVVFRTEEGQRKAIEQFNDKELGGKRIQVRDGASRGEYFTVFVAGLDGSTTTESLSRHFGHCGEVVDAYIMKSKETGESRCMGKVSFRSEDAHRKALEEADGSSLDGHRISVKPWSRSGGMGNQEGAVRAARDAGDPDELRVNPEDGLAYTWSELQQRRGQHVSPLELADYWKFDCRPAPPGAARGGSSGGSRPIAVWDGGKPRVGPEPGTAQGRGAAALGIQEWLEAVDAVWLRRMEAKERVPADRGARSCLRALRRRFDSLDQILSAYAERLPGGKLSLKDAFFDDCGITKLGHKRLMKNWITENA